MAAKKNIFDIAEGYYLSQILVFLNEAGYFDTKKKKKRINISPTHLNHLLQVLVERTDIIKKQKDGRHVTATAYRHYPALGFHIEKLIQSYSHVAPDKKNFRLVTDERQFAAAYQKVYPYQNWNFLLSLIKQLPVKHLLDLGCGAGALAVQFCKQGKTHTAAGVDAGTEMCHTARHFVQQAKLNNRIHIYCEKAAWFNRVLSAREMEQTDIIVASNLLNEFFGSEGAPAVRLIRKLKKYFPGRSLLAVDYYGVLGTARQADASLTHNYVHDMLQLFSGQGVPPSNYRQWQKIYRQAGCQSELVYEGKNSGVNWFIHQVML